MNTPITVVSIAPTPVSVLVVEPVTMTVVSVGSGLQGVPGPRGLPGASVDLYLAGVALGGHVAVVLNASGQVIAADAGNPRHYAVAGITTGACIQGAPVEVRSKGFLEHLGWTFTPDAPVFLGLYGALTQTVPGTAVFSKMLGIAVSPTCISLDLQPAIFF